MRFDQTEQYSFLFLFIEHYQSPQLFYPQTHTSDDFHNRDCKFRDN